MWTPINYNKKRFGYTDTNAVVTEVPEGVCECYCFTVAKAQHDKACNVVKTQSVRTRPTTEVHGKHLQSQHTTWLLLEEGDYNTHMLIRSHTHTHGALLPNLHVNSLRSKKHICYTLTRLTVCANSHFNGKQLRCMCTMQRRIWCVWHNSSGTCASYIYKAESKQLN